jgi:hypothetical protein
MAKKKSGEKAVKTKKGGNEWKAIVESLWFVYWVDENQDNHGADILFGPFATREAAELYISLEQYTDNQYAVSGIELFLGQCEQAVFTFYGSNYKSSQQPVANTNCNFPNGWEPQSGKRSFKMKSIGKVQVIGIDDSQFGSVVSSIDEKTKPIQKKATKKKTGKKKVTTKAAKKPKNNAVASTLMGEAPLSKTITRFRRE